MGHSALKRSACPRSKQAALFSDLHKHGLLCSKPPSNSKLPLSPVAPVFLKRFCFLVNPRRFPAFPEIYFRPSAICQLFARLSEIWPFPHFHPMRSPPFAKILKTPASADVCKSRNLARLRYFAEIVLPRCQFRNFRPRINQDNLKDHPRYL